MNIETSFEQFCELAERGNLVPVFKEVMADLLTPVSAFLRTTKDAEHAFLLESVEGGEQLARYSFLGKGPFMVIRSKGGRVFVEKQEGIEEREESFLEVVRELMAQYESPDVDGLPRFSGGAVGFLGYAAAAWFEPSLEPHWRTVDVESDDVQDDAAFMVFDTVLAFDHVKHRILIIANTPVFDGCDLREKYEGAQSKIQAVEEEISLSESGQSMAMETDSRLEWTTNTTQETYEASVRRAQEYIRAGDIYQVVLSQRFDAETDVDPFTVYRTLRYVNPSPYMYFMRIGELSIVGSSPEMLVRVEGRRVETHPIAGTRARGSDEAEDRRLAEELRRNEKECAEHVMLVDLGRNDVGRVSEYGSVEVSRYMTLERYSHVMHLVSRVEGQLADGRDRLNALEACFPAGTVSGAPKIRAMEIIAELEPERRGIYAGAVGYLDFSGHLDCCITIRTIAMSRGRASVQAGAGIVADSVATAEYQETLDKASALIRALEIAQGSDPRSDRLRK